MLSLAQTLAKCDELHDEVVRYKRRVKRAQREDTNEKGYKRAESKADVKKKKKHMRKKQRANAQHTHS